MRTLFLFTGLLLAGCTMQKEPIDLLITDATIYTVNESFDIHQAMAIKEGKVIATGSKKAIEKRYAPVEVRSLKGKFIYPGWYDAHAHFTGYGLTLREVDLMGTTSRQEVIQRCRAYAETFSGEWITGRGWDQNDWPQKIFPTKEELDAAFPDRPVILRRVDGHAAWANSRALELGGVTALTQVEGGSVAIKNGEPTGILIDNAYDLIAQKIPKPTDKEIAEALLEAQKNCFAVGLTSVSDAGLDANEVQVIDSLMKQGELKMRVNAWLNPTKENFTTYLEKGVQQNERLTLGTLKLYADGALGSRGARMQKDYSDDPGNRGLFVTTPDSLKVLCEKALEHDFQVAIHCIGDAANHVVLGIYGDLLEPGNDRRWRIEHAQIIDPKDFDQFGKYGIVPSVQTTHATSDMPWAEERLGAERMEGAYSYQTLLQQNGWIPNGSDFPVESINPLFGFFSGVARKDHSGWPEEGFQIAEGWSREQALRAMTLWAARSGFEERFKGSLEPGKVADFVVTSKDIMEIPELEIPQVKVDLTYVDGKVVYVKANGK